MMRLVAIGLVGLIPAAASAQSVSVVQSNRANVYGLVQAGPQNGPVTVKQTGTANVVGIIQAGPRNQVSVSQTGALNRATVGQFSWQGARGGFMP